MKRVRGLSLALFVLIFIGIFVCIFDMYNNSFNDKSQKVVFLSDGQEYEGTFVKGTVGEKRGIIILHDEGLDRNSMTSLASAFNKEGYHVLYYDMPGHGSSDGVFKTQYYTNDHLVNILGDAVEKLLSVTELKEEDVSYAGVGLGARVALKYSTISEKSNDLYLIKPFSARSDSDLLNTNLVKVGRKDSALVLFSNSDKEYNTYMIPAIYERMTNEEYDRTSPRNESMHGNIEFSRFDMIVPGIEAISNGFIKKIIFTASMKEGFDLSSDYFNTRSIVLFLTLILIICQLFLLNRSFLPNIPSTRKEKSPYVFGVKRLLLSIVIIALYIVYRMYFRRTFVTEIFPFFEDILILFLAYGLTGLLSLKYKKAIKIGNSSVSAAVSILIGLLIVATFAAWAYLSLISMSLLKTKLIYLGINILCAWIAFYFYTLDFSVMYMMGASALGQKYLIRLVFMLPFIMLFLIDYLLETGDLLRMVMQYILVFVCIYLAEGLQRVGNKMIYASFFPAVLYGFITTALTIMI